MSTFKSQLSSSSITVRSGESRTGIIVIWDGGSINLDPADAPKIALDVLEAAGVEARDLTAWTRGCADDLSKIAFDLTEHVRCAKVFAAAAAKEAARGKRRDELARELYLAATGHDDGIGVDHRSPVTQAAIDRIYDLEQELAKERAK